jgi:hypothetical protein
MAITMVYRTAPAMKSMPKKIATSPVQVTTAAMRSNTGVLRDTAGPEEQLAVKSGVELGKGAGHCYGRQPTGCGVLDESYIFG